MQASLVSTARPVNFAVLPLGNSSPDDGPQVIQPSPPHVKHVIPGSEPDDADQEADDLEEAGSESHKSNDADVSESAKPSGNDYT